MKRLFILLGMLCAITTVFSQNIVKAEYFIDVDPGQGNGTPITNFSAGDTVNFSATIATANLSQGFHFLCVRVANASGTWSRSETRGFYLSSTTAINTADIVFAEFFIDSDPGPGGGWPVNIGTSGPVVNFTAISPVPLNPGFHFIGLRVKDANGKWGLFEQRGFYVTPFPGNMPPLVAAEYFFDNDPGPGNATAIDLAQTGDTINQQFLISAPAGLTGQHFLGLRMKDQSGHWSFFATDTINITGAAISCPGNVTISSDGLCSAVVNNISPTVAPGNGYSYTLSGATTGSGSGTASGTTFNAGVTTVTYSVNNSPATTCSFTVTVNVIPTVTINASSTATCPGSTIIFTALSTNEGVNPSYQWKKNGVNIGLNSNILQTNVLSDGDIITVDMTSSISCASPATVTSNAITVTITPPTITPMVNITASSTSICPGTSVTFTAASTNGGSTPGYSWYQNGVLISGANGSTFQTSTLANNDKIKCVLTSSLTCVTSATATSNEITMTVSSNAPATVTIAASQTSICAGQSVTFTSTSTNVGNPVYEWLLNGNVVGPNTNYYTTTSLANGDVVKLTVQTQGTCAGNSSVTSNSITMIVSSGVVPSVNITASSTDICPGNSVTFTANPVNQGSNPTYQWKLNGTNIPGATGPTYQTSTLSNGDQVKLAMLSSLSCANPTDVVSNVITMTAGTDGGIASVSIYASPATICSGGEVTFVATPVNGGNTPHYQWKLNGVNVGDDFHIYVTSSLQNGDSVKVIMVSSSCVSQPTVVSNTIGMTVGQIVTPSVSIVASANPICSGQLVTFTAEPVNGGNNPTYYWRVNGNFVSSTGPTYQSSSLQNGDSIEVFMGSALSCANPQSALSNSIHIVVSQPVTPSVSIVASTVYACPGLQVNFTATPTNGGSNPGYQWKKNGFNVGVLNSDLYQTTALQPGDVITVVMTPSLCASPGSATSNAITMIVSPTLTPSVTITASATEICAGSPVTFDAHPVNGGNIPHYQWKLNGNNVGDDSPFYYDSTLVQNDEVKVVMTSSLGCVSPQAVTSNAIGMTISPLKTYYADYDGDGYGDPASGTMQACGASSPSWVLSGGDCDDFNPAINPGATEICGNGIDDNCNGLVDENCNSNLPTLITRNYPVKEGDAGLTLLNVQVNLDTIATLPVSIQYTTFDEDATAGLDYVAKSGTLTIPAGSSSGTIQLQIIGDLLRESNERFKINFSHPVNVLFGTDSTSKVMIHDDDKEKGGHVTEAGRIPAEEEIFRIPSVAKRNQVWTIPQIGNYKNEISIMNAQGQTVKRLVNYQNQLPLNNVSAGLYFYRIFMVDGKNQIKYYSGRLLITE